jgi:energy-converting hydrogenase Eha subunit A
VVLMSAVLPVRVVVLPVIAAALGQSLIKRVVVRLPAVLQVRPVVSSRKASAVNLNIVILIQVALAVHLNVQFLV